MIYIDNDNIEIIMLKKYMEDKAPTNEEEIENMRNRLKRAMSRLNKNERTILKMYFYEEKEEKEIADELGKLQPSINRTKNSAIKKLKELLIA